MSVPELDYDSLLETALNLGNFDEIRNFVLIHPDLSTHPNVWRDLIHREFGLRLRNATEDDYDLMEAITYLTFPKLESKKPFLEEVREIIMEGLTREEKRSEEDYKVWKPHKKQYLSDIGSDIGTKAKTIGGAFVNFIEYSPETIDKIFRLYSGKYTINNILGARRDYKSAKRALDLLNRLESGNNSYLPTREEVEKCLEESKKEGYIDRDERIVEHFIYMLTGDDDNWPYIKEHRRLRLL